MKEKTWETVKEWTTKAGLKAKVIKCMWSDEVKFIAPSLHDHFNGYVQAPEGDKTKYYDNPKIDVHGGVTYEGDLDKKDGRWVGFDMAHLGDENKQELSYAVEQCEQLAEQIKNNFSFQ